MSVLCMYTLHTVHLCMQEPLDALVLDIANMDSSSTDYPLARHKDMFDFHSWASGLFPQGNGKSQESISEVKRFNKSYAKVFVQRLL
jgi:endoglucanase Acf2